MSLGHHAPQHPKMQEPQHLGDGVYIGHDGYQLWLSVGDHMRPTVALEPGLAQKILDYAKKKGVGL